MNSTHITYTSRPDTTPEAELAVLANTYRFVLDCHSRKIAAEPAPEPDGHGEAKEAWLLHGDGVLMGSGTSAGAVVRMRGGDHVETSPVRTNQRTQRERK